MSTNESIEFKFVAIQTNSKSLKRLSSNKVDVEFNFVLTVSGKVEDTRGLVIMNVVVVIKDQEFPDDHLAEFDVDCVFEISDFKKHIKLNEQGLYVIPALLDTIFKPVSISTVRGIIHSELKGTYLSRAIMPVIFMDSLQPKPQ